MNCKGLNRLLTSGGIPLGKQLSSETGNLLSEWVTTPTASAAGYAPGALAIDSTNALVYRNTGTAAAATWTVFSTSSTTIDGVFDNGQTIDSAATGKRLRVGDGTDYTEFYSTNASAMSYIYASHGLTIAPVSNLTLVPAGGTVAITGALTVSGTLTAGTFAPSSLACAALTTSFAVSSGCTQTMTGADGSTIFTITAGDAVLSDGSLAITDSDNAASLSVTNATATTAAGVVNITAAGVTTGRIVNIAATALSSGEVLRLSAVEATLTSGLYLNCYDGAASDFSVGRYGATIIAGNAAGTAALSITNGDIALAAGKITVDTVADITNYFKRNKTGANTAAVVLIEATHTGEQKPALTVDGKMTGAYDAMTVTYAGTGNAVTVTNSAATGTALGLVAAASATDSLMKMTCTGTAATGFLGANGVGMVNITSDGNLAHANASLLCITYSGTGAATGLGTSLRIVDTGATSTSYAAYISAATGEALYVAVGKAKFAESVILDTGITFTTSGAVLTEDATNTYLDAGAANETFNFGNTTAMDVLFHGSGAAGEDCQWDASGSCLKFAAGAALVLPQGTASGGSGRQAVEGSMFWETDAGKLWVYKGAGWVGVTLA
jgi:hypothetical protein